IRPIQNGAPAPVPYTGALLKDEFGPPLATARTPAALARIRAGAFMVRFTPSPPTIHIERSQTAGRDIQRLTFDATAPGMSFLLGQGPLLGLCEGGAGFD